MKNLAEIEIRPGTVKNLNGAEINFEAAVNLMEDDLREEIHKLGLEDNQSFFNVYEKVYFVKYGEIWELSKENPVY